MSELLSERFVRLPALQEQRELEYTQQARQAHTLTDRLDATRLEAERVALAEIERTKRMMEEAVRQHPDWLRHAQELEAAGRAAREWEMDKARQLSRLERQLAVVRKRVEEKAAEYDAMFSQQDRQKVERSQLDRELEDARCELERAEGEIGALSATEQALQSGLASDRQALSEVSKEFEEVKRVLSGRELEREKWEREVAGLKQALDAENDEAARIGEMIASLSTKKSTLEGNYASSSALKIEITEQLDHERGAIAAHQAVLASAQQQLSQAQAILSTVKGQKTEFEGQKQLLVGSIQMRQGDIDALYVQQRSITEQINRLMEERNKIEQEIGGKNREIVDIHIQLDEQEAIIRGLDEQEREAVEVADRAFNLVGSQTAILSEAIVRQKGLEDEQSRTEMQEREASELISEIDRSQQQLLHKQQHEIIPQADRWRLLLSKRSSEFEDTNDDSLRAKYEGLSALISARLTSTQTTSNQLANIREQLAGRRSQLGAISGKVSSLESRLQNFPVITDAAIASLNTEITALNEELSSINEQVANLQGPNPNQFRLAAARTQEPSIRSACWDHVKQNPSPRITAQLAREAEAVMRAEAAVACAKKQRQVQQEADDLAKFHLYKTPRVVLDDKARDVMLSECTGKRPKHEIAGLVLDMCEQRHIAIK